METGRMNSTDWNMYCVLSVGNFKCSEWGRSGKLHFLPCPEDFLQTLWELLHKKPLMPLHLFLTHDTETVFKCYQSSTLPFARTVGACPCASVAPILPHFLPHYSHPRIPCPPLPAPRLTLIFLLLSSQSFSLIPPHWNTIFTFYYCLPGFFLALDPHPSCTLLLHHLPASLCPITFVLLWIWSHLFLSLALTFLLPDSFLPSVPALPHSDSPLQSVILFPLPLHPPL